MLGLVLVLALAITLLVVSSLWFLRFNQKSLAVSTSPLARYSSSLNFGPDDDDDDNEDDDEYCRCSSPGDGCTWK